MPSPASGSRAVVDDVLTDDGRDRGWWLAALVAVWAAWCPVETNPVSGPLVAASVGVLVVWRWERGAARSGRLALWVLVPVLAVLGVSGLAGRDPSRALPQLALALAIGSALWAARTARPPRWAPFAVAAAIAGLAVWAAWQQLVGLEGLESGLQDLAAAQREYVEARLAAGRPSASQLLPGHFAVLLATALPLLIGSSGTTRSSGWRWFLVALASGGLLLSRSPIGIALAILAVGVVAAHGRARRLTFMAPVLLVLASAVVVATRPDVVRLDPLTLRVDNWRTAVAVWREAPVAGVGFGGFGQAAQTVDLELGNRPAHAHSVVGEGLAELGPLGASVSILVLMAVARVAWRLRLEDPGLSASIMVVPLHNLFDFSWWVSGVALPWAVVFGWAVGRVGSVVPEVSSRRHDPVRMMVTVTATIAFALTVLHATSRWTEWTTDPSAPAPQRVEAFERSWRLAPWRTDPALRAAVAAVEADDPSALERVARSLDRVAILRPFSADVATVRALVEQARGDGAAAAAAAWNADRRRGVTDRGSSSGVPDRGAGGPGAPLR